MEHKNYFGVWQGLQAASHCRNGAVEISENVWYHSCTKKNASRRLLHEAFHFSVMF